MKRMLFSVLATALVMASPSGHALAALPTQVQGEELPTLAPMLEQVIPGVVNIAAEGRVRARDPFFDDPLFRRFFGLPDEAPSRRTQSLGSGVVLDAEKGYVVTNNHVIAKADKITIKLQGGRSVAAEVIGTDPESDIAVLKIPAADLTEIPIGNSEHLRVGDFVVAIGSPFGLGQTVTSGIVSALGRSGLGIEGYEDFIQTDASINPGNSGGALVNLRGELIGINTAILSRSGGNIGIGFAIPINMVQAITEQLVEYGEVRRGLLGVHIQDLTPELADAFGIDATSGTVITRVVSESAADEAGLQSGDVVVAVNGRQVRNAADLRNAIGLLRVGDEVRLEIIRDGERKMVSAVIGEAKVAQVDAGQLDPRLAGARFGNITEDSPLYGRVEGVVIQDVEGGSAAWNAGLRPDDVIVSVNRQRVRDVEQFRELVRRNEGALLLNVRRGNGALFLLLR